MSYTCTAWHWIWSQLTRCRMFNMSYLICIVYSLYINRYDFLDIHALTLARKISSSFRISVIYFFFFAMDYLVFLSGNSLICEPDPDSAQFTKPCIRIGQKKCLKCLWIRDIQLRTGICLTLHLDLSIASNKAQQQSCEKYLSIN